MHAPTPIFSWTCSSTTPPQCPKDISFFPVVTLFAMGRSGRAALEAKLCDLFERPADACKNGKYQVRDKAAGVQALFFECDDQA